MCVAAACPRRIFAERLPTVVAPYARRTNRLTEVMTAFSFALGGKASSRLITHLNLHVSSSTMLRLIRRTPQPRRPTPRVLGVDDWARRKGQTYGTILVDLERQSPVDLLPDRTADTLKAWLQEHPGVEIVARDRSTEYTRGVTEGVPQARQVADRFHLLMNLREAVEHILDRNRACLRGIVLPRRGDRSDGGVPAEAQRTPARRSPAEERVRAARQVQRHERYQHIRTLQAQGISIRGIARALQLNRGTVYRYLRLDEASAGGRTHHVPSMLDPHLPYLYQRWRGGCQNGMQLWRELRARGYPGSRKMVATWVRHQRQTPAPTTPRKYLPSLADQDAFMRVDDRRIGRPASSRQLAWFLLRDPHTYTVAEQAALAELQQVCRDVALVYPLVQAFLSMVRERAVERFDAWLTAVTATEVRDLQNFAAGLQRDQVAVQGALALPWSTGPVEGHINRLKLIKRQMYGRANFDLLRRRILHAV